MYVGSSDDLVDDSCLEEDSTAMPPRLRMPSTESQSLSQFSAEGCAGYESPREHSLNPSSLLGMTVREGRRRGREMVLPTSEQTPAVNRPGSMSTISASEGQKNEFSISTSTTESISQALHCLQESGMMMTGGGGGLPMQLDQMQGIHQQRSSGMPPRGGMKQPPVTQQQQQHHERDLFAGRDLLSPHDEVDQRQHHDQRMSMRLARSSGNQDGLTSPDIATGRSLSHPNLTSMNREGESSGSMLQQPGDAPASKGMLPHSAQASILTHSQTGNPPPPVPFHGNLGSFALSSMMGHFAPQLQPHPLPSSAIPPANPSSIDADLRGGRSPGLGAPAGSSRSGSGSIAQSRIPAITTSSSSGSTLLGGGLNPSLSIINPTFNMGGVGLQGGGLGCGGGGGVVNLPHSSNPSMPLAHPIACNAPSLSLLSGMPTVYSYPYTATLPTQSISSSMVRMNAPGSAGFAPPGQALAPGGGYNQYMPPSLYGNAPPPVSTGNYT